MDFKEWITKKYLEWRGDKWGNEASAAKFAELLGVDKSILGKWMSGTKKPGVQNLKVIAEVYPEVYEVMGLVVSATDAGVTIPLFGHIGAGVHVSIPSSDLRNYDPESTITVLRSWIPRNIELSSLFALVVDGDSMSGASINDGDTVILRKTSTAKNGDVVAVRIGQDEYITLKRFYRDNGTIRLQPATDGHDAIILPADQVTIEGRLVALIRMFKGE